jgi:hypothetical protein
MLEVRVFLILRDKKSPLSVRVFFDGASPFSVRSQGLLNSKGQKAL